MYFSIYLLMHLRLPEHRGEHDHMEPSLCCCGAIIWNGFDRRRIKRKRKDNEIYYYDGLKFSDDEDGEE